MMYDAPPLPPVVIEHTVAEPTYDVKVTRSLFYHGKLLVPNLFWKFGEDDTSGLEFRLATTFPISDNKDRIIFYIEAGCGGCTGIYPVALDYDHENKRLRPVALFNEQNKPDFILTKTNWLYSGLSPDGMKHYHIEGLWGLSEKPLITPPEVWVFDFKTLKHTMVGRLVPDLDVLTENDGYRPLNKGILSWNEQSEILINPGMLYVE